MRQCATHLLLTFGVFAHALVCRLAAHPALRVAPATVAFLTTAGDLDTDPAWFAVRPPSRLALLTKALTREHVPFLACWRR